VLLNPLNWWRRAMPSSIGYILFIAFAKPRDAKIFKMSPITKGRNPMLKTY
jgi:hypothetical protein